jgi:hypothetical protein
MSSDALYDASSVWAVTLPKTLTRGYTSVVPKMMDKVKASMLPSGTTTAHDRSMLASIPTMTSLMGGLRLPSSTRATLSELDAPWAVRDASDVDAAIQQAVLGEHVSDALLAWMGEHTWLPHTMWVRGFTPRTWAWEGWPALEVIPRKSPCPVTWTCSWVVAHPLEDTGVRLATLRRAGCMSQGKELEETLLHMRSTLPLAEAVYGMGRETNRPPILILDWASEHIVDVEVHGTDAYGPHTMSFLEAMAGVAGPSVPDAVSLWADDSVLPLTAPTWTDIGVGLPSDDDTAPFSLLPLVPEWDEDGRVLARGTMRVLTEDAPPNDIWLHSVVPLQRNADGVATAYKFIVRGRVRHMLPPLNTFLVTWQPITVRSLKLNRVIQLYKRWEFMLAHPTYVLEMHGMLPPLPHPETLTWLEVDEATWRWMHDTYATYHIHMTKTSGAMWAGEEDVTTDSGVTLRRPVRVRGRKARVGRIGDEVEGDGEVDELGFKRLHRIAYHSEGEEDEEDEDEDSSDSDDDEVDAAHTIHHIVEEVPYSGLPLSSELERWLTDEEANAMRYGFAGADDDDHHKNVVVDVAPKTMSRDAWMRVGATIGKAMARASINVSGQPQKVRGAREWMEAAAESVYTQMHPSYKPPKGGRSGADEEGYARSMEAGDWEGMRERERAEALGLTTSTAPPKHIDFGMLRVDRLVLHVQSTQHWTWRAVAQCRVKRVRKSETQTLIVSVAFQGVYVWADDDAELTKAPVVKVHTTKDAWRVYLDDWDVGADQEGFKQGAGVHVNGARDVGAEAATRTLHIPAGMLRSAQNMKRTWARAVQATSAT